MQAKAPAERDVEALLCGFETTSNRSWPNESWIIHVNNPWLNYGWLWSHRRTTHPGDFRSWESPQTLPALFIGPFEHVERFRNLKFAVMRITDIQSTVLSSSEGTAAIHLAFK